MTTKIVSLDKLRGAIAKLSRKDSAVLTAWFPEYQNRGWVKQIDSDSDSRRHDSFAAEVKAEYKARRAKLLDNSSA